MMYLISNSHDLSSIDTVELKCRRQYQSVSFLVDDKRYRVPAALVNKSLALHLHLNVTDECRVLVSIDHKVIDYSVS